MSTAEEKAIERMRQKNAARQAELDRRHQEKIEQLQSQSRGYEQEYAREELKQAISRDLNNNPALTASSLRLSYYEYIEKYNLNFDAIYSAVIKDRKKKELESVKKEREKKKEQERKHLKNEVDKILNEGKLISRQEFDEIICNRHTYELIDCREVSLAILTKEYSNKLNAKATGNENILMDELILLGALLDKTSEQVKADLDQTSERVKAKLLQKIQNENEEKRLHKIKVISTCCIWSIAAILITLQVIFLQWWTILTGILTAIAVIYAFLIKKGIEEAPKENRKQMIWVQGLTWGIAMLLIILEIIFWGWWAILSGVATFVVAQFISLKNLNKRSPKYDSDEMDILFLPSSFFIDILYI